MAGSLMATRSRARKPKPRRRTTRTPDRSLTPTGPGDKLTDAQQTAVVQRLAMYDSPQQVADWVKEEFGIDMTRQAVQYYDPTAVRSRREVVCNLRGDAHQSSSKRQLTSRSPTNRCACAGSSGWRSQREDSGTSARSSLHEQAAKEVGELYTNRHKMEHTGKDGEPIEVKTDDLRNRIARRIAGVASRIGTHSNHIRS
jgi:hypothetical protein